MNGIFRLFLDTAPVIYFLDNDLRYAEKVRSILDDAIIVSYDALRWKNKNNENLAVYTGFSFRYRLK